MAFPEFSELGDGVKAIAVGFAPGSPKFPARVPRPEGLGAHPQKNRRLFYHKIFFPLEPHSFLYAIIASMFSLRELSLFCLYAAFFLLPLWVLPFTASPLDLNKIYLAYFLFMLAAVFWFAHSLQTGRVALPKNLAFVFLAAFLASFAVSAFLSPAGHVAFVGMGNEPLTLSALGLFSLAFFLGAVLFSSESSFRALLILFSSFTLMVIFQFFQSILKIQLFSFFPADPTFNLFGSWNDLGIFTGLILLSSVITFDFLPRSLFKVFCGIVLALSLVTAATVNFNLAWWLTAFYLTVLLAYLYSRGGASRRFFRLPFFILIVALFFLLARPLASNFLSSMGIQFVEVRPSWNATWQVITGALKESPAFGTGPASFGYDWLKYRPADIAQTPFWQVRFSAGAGLLPSLLAEAGLVGMVLFIGFLWLFLWQGFKALVGEKEEDSFLKILFFLGALYLWTAAFVYAVGFLIVFLVFLFTGIFFALAVLRREGAWISFSLFERSGLGFISALVMIFMVVLLVSWFYVLGQKYYAAVVYGQGVLALNRGDADGAEQKLSAAIRFDGRDRYLRSLTDFHLARLQEVLQSRDLPENEARARFQDVLGQAIQNAQTAVNLNPADYLNWMNLGRIYEAVVPFKIRGASDFAKAGYGEALKRFPSNPEAYLAQARVSLLDGNSKDARDFLLKAVDAKRDYAPAHFLLAQLEASSGNLSEAIRRAETTVLLVPNDIGVLFQLGLLYYQNKNFSDAKIVLERAVELNSNYSNARYFLGLIYDRAGEKAKALEEFQKILALNPDNNEIRQIIGNLNSNKPALFGISPPASPPERRAGVPVQDSAGPNAERAR